MAKPRDQSLRVWDSRWVGGQEMEARLERVSNRAGAR